MTKWHWRGLQPMLLRLRFISRDWSPAHNETSPALKRKHIFRTSLMGQAIPGSALRSGWDG